MTYIIIDYRFTNVYRCLSQNLYVLRDTTQMKVPRVGPVYQKSVQKVTGAATTTRNLGQTQAGRRNSSCRCVSNMPVMPRRMRQPPWDGLVSGNGNQLTEMGMSELRAKFWHLSLGLHSLLLGFICIPPSPEWCPRQHIIQLSRAGQSRHGETEWPC